MRILLDIEPGKRLDFCELDPLLCKMRTTKQKQLLTFPFLELKETYMTEGKTAFHKKFNYINGLSGDTKVLVSSFKEFGP